MPNPLLHIRVPLEGIELLRQARIQAMIERKTLGVWLTELLREALSKPAVRPYEVVRPSKIVITPGVMTIPP